MYRGRGGWGGGSGAEPSRGGLFDLVLVRLDLDERVVGMHGLRRFVQHAECIRVVIFGGELSLYGRPKSAQAAEGMVHGRSFVTTMYHAVRALGIAGLRAVVLPLGGVQQFLEGVHVAVL